jgi:hypothetical protein
MCVCCCWGAFAFFWPCVGANDDNDDGEAAAAAPVTVSRRLF